MPIPAIFYVYCCESPVKPTHQVGRLYLVSFQNCYIAAIGEKNREVCPHQSVAKIACDFRSRSNSPRSAYKIARCVAGFTNLVFLVRTVSYGSSFFPVHLWPSREINWKNSKRNLRYGPRTRLVRGMFQWNRKTVFSSFVERLFREGFD